MMTAPTRAASLLTGLVSRSPGNLHPLWFIGLISGRDLRLGKWRQFDAVSANNW
jgi:hypothetical protein